MGKGKKSSGQRKGARTDALGVPIRKRKDLGSVKVSHLLLCASVLVCTGRSTLGLVKWILRLLLSFVRLLR